VQFVASGFGLNEGTTWVRDGHGSGFLLLGGLLDNVLYKIAPDSTVSVFMEKAGYSGDDADSVGAQTRAGRSHVLLIGPSCSGVDPAGRILWCADDDRKVMRLEKDGQHTVLSEGAGGKRFNGPNDISIKSDGAVYLTDNDFGLRGAMKSPLKELQDAVWLIKDGKTLQLLTDKELGGIPNGVTLSADEKFLYLSAFNKMMRYAVNPDDTIGAGSLFAQGVGIREIFIPPAVPVPVSYGSQLRRGNCWAPSTCRCSVRNRKNRSAQPMWHLARPTEKRYSSPPAMRFTRSG
jgi:gluconolactonase